jgi:hypothetical protein
MSMFARIGMLLGVFLIGAGVIYGVVASQIGPKDYEGTVLILAVAGGALLTGTYLARAVQRARASLAAQPADAAAAEAVEPHVAPTIWPLVLALSMFGLVFGAVESRWALVGGGVLLVVALAGWSLDTRRQWQHHEGTGIHDGVDQGRGS